jgi:O-antigen/teichoic acid export membrane protein
MTDSRRLARNSAVNLLGLTLPLIVALLTIPPLVRGLGAERFGILTLAWAAIGYFSLFELGLSRALTQAVAQRLGNGGREELPGIVWTSLVLLFVLGTLGGAVVAAITPGLVTRLLNVPVALQRETVISFYVLAATLPLVVTAVGLRGLMEAHQDFGMVNLLRVPLVGFMFLGPLLVLPFSRSLVPAVGMLVVGRVIGWGAHVAYCWRRYAYLRGGILIQPAIVSPLLRYGGWTTVTNVVSPVMVFMDRFVIGALLPIAAVTHYVTPYEVVTKLLIIAGAILGAMFPAFAATYENDRGRMAILYERSLRAVILAMFPVVLVAVAFAHEGLLLWTRNILPNESAIVLQWLAIGVFINAIGQAPYAALQGAARPDLIAKVHLIELPIYLATLFVLVRNVGLTGAAIAWTGRVAADAVALIVIARRHLGVSTLPRFGGGFLVAAMLAACVASAMLTTTTFRAAFVAIVLSVFAVIAWFRFLTPTERVALRSWMRSPLSLQTTATPREVA